MPPHQLTLCDQRFSFFYCVCTCADNRTVERARTFSRNASVYGSPPAQSVLTYADKQCRVYPVVQSDTVIGFFIRAVIRVLESTDWRNAMPMRSAPHSSIPASTTSSTNVRDFPRCRRTDRYDGLKKEKELMQQITVSRVELYQIKTGSRALAMA